MIINVTKDTFEKEVSNSEIPVLLDFWAPWCGHCTNLAPTIDEIAKEKEGQVKVCKINIDEVPEIAMQYGVMTIPTCAKFIEGEIKAKCVGALPKDDLLKQLEL